MCEVFVLLQELFDSSSSTQGVDRTLGLFEPGSIEKWVTLSLLMEETFCE